MVKKKVQRKAISCSGQGSPEKKLERGRVINFLDNKYEINKRVWDGEERGGGLGLPPQKFLTLPLSSFFSALPCPLLEIACLCTFFF